VNRPFGDPVVVLATIGAWTAIGLVFTAAIWAMLRREDRGGRLNVVAGVSVDGGVAFRRSGRVLLVCEVALAFALTAAALSMLQHLRTMLNEDAAMDPKRLLVLDIFFPPEALKPAVPALEALISVVAARQDVKSVALVNGFPLSGRPIDVMARGGDGPIARAWQPCDLHVVTPSYADIVDLKLVEGRWLGSSDVRAARPAAVISETMSRRYFQGESPVGKRLRSGSGDAAPEWDIVGVIREPKRLGTRADPKPSIYVPWAQATWANMSLLVRTGGDARRVAAFVRDQALRMVPGAVEVRKIRTGTDIVAEAAARSRFVGAQLLGLAALALLLASTGIYSIVSFRNSLRAREMAVRIAVGGSRTRVVTLVVRETMTLVGLGVAAGLPLSLGLEGLLATFREGGEPMRTMAYVATVVVFCAVATAASLPSAIRAASVDPAPVLRSEQ
jgi:hypothetical protein